MDGFLNVLKPRGVTSHDVVVLVRKLLREERTGHLGTLDPLAVGVLPMACGAYRRLSEYFLGEDKRYFSEFTFGIRTDTGDTDGRVVEERDAQGVRPEQVREAAQRLVGRILQVPPAFSALKVKGKKMVDLARMGIDPEREPREVQVHEFSLQGWLPGARPKGLFSLRVGRGTYVRSLAFSLGDDLGCGAAVSYLLRERSGKFLLRDALTVPALRRLSGEGRVAGALSDSLAVMPDYPVFALRPEALEKVIHGVPLEVGDLAVPAGSRLAAILAEGPFPVRSLAVVDRSGPGGRREIAAVVMIRGPAAIEYEKVLVHQPETENARLQSDAV